MFKFDTKTRNKIIGLIGLVVIASSVGGGVVGYYLGTGTFPMLGGTTAVAPNPIPANASEAQVLDFLQTDKTDLVPYGEGFNCVEYAMVLGLKGRWQGIASMIIRVDFENEPFAHILIAYQTSDKGLIFIDPESDTEVYPHIGGQLAGKTITGLYALKSEWVSFEVIGK